MKETINTVISIAIIIGIIVTTIITGLWPKTVEIQKTTNQQIVNYNQ